MNYALGKVGENARARVCVCVCVYICSAILGLSRFARGVYATFLGLIITHFSIMSYKVSNNIAYVVSFIKKKSFKGNYLTLRAVNLAYF